MFIQIIERCCHDGEITEGCYTGTRTIVYKVQGGTLRDAINEYEDDFDSDNIISCQDDFEEDCRSSYIESVCFYEY